MVCRHYKPTELNHYRVAVRTSLPHTCISCENSFFNWIRDSEPAWIWNLDLLDRKQLLLTIEGHYIDSFQMSLSGMLDVSLFWLQEWKIFIFSSKFTFHIHSLELKTCLRLSSKLFLYHNYYLWKSSGQCSSTEIRVLNRTFYMSDKFYLEKNSIGLT